MRNRSRFGWIELIEGILLIILGIFSFLRPDSMLSGFVTVSYTHLDVYKRQCLHTLLSCRFDHGLEQITRILLKI